MRLAAFTLAAMLSSIAISHAFLRAGERDADRPWQASSPADVEKERQAFLKQLGDAPVFQIEILYRGEADGRLYLCRTVLSAKRPHCPMGMPGLGLDAKGKPVPPPNPGYHPVQRAAEEFHVKDGKPVPRSWHPPAETTREVGARLEKESPGTLDCFVSDMATRMKLPEKANEPAVLFFHWRLFRVDRLTAEQVQKYEPLRDDPECFRQRTATLIKELLTTHRARLTSDEPSLAGAAVLLQEPFLVDLLRERCQRWIDRPGNERAGFPIDVMRALGEAGDTADVKLLHSWVKRRPEEVPMVAWAVLSLTRRKGTREAMPLLADLLRDATPAEPEGNAKRLLAADKSLPAPTRGDQFLISLLAQRKRSPADFGFNNVPERVLVERLTFSVADRERMESAAMFPLPSDWLFVTPAERTRAVERALAWLGQQDALK